MGRYIGLVKNERSYNPSAELIKYLESRLQYEIKMKKRKSAAEEGTSKNYSNRMSRLKNYYLNNYVFPSMANLIVFIERVSSSPELRKVFDKDMKELFFAVSSKDSKNYQRPIFRRFMEAILGAPDLEIDDYKFILAEIAQRALVYKMQGVAHRRFDSDTIVNNLINPDLARAAIWFQLLANEARKQNSDGFNPTNRPVSF